MARIPARCAISMSSGASPTYTQTFGDSPSRSSAIRSGAGCGLRRGASSLQTFVRNIADTSCSRNCRRARARLPLETRASVKRRSSAQSTRRAPGCSSGRCVR